MKKETTIDLAKLKEARKTISSMQQQFSEMVVETINNLDFLSCSYSDTLGYFFSQIKVSEFSVDLEIKVSATHYHREKTGYRNVTELREIEFDCPTLGFYSIVIGRKHIGQLNLYCNSMPLPSHYTFNGRKLTTTNGKRIS